MSLSNEIKFCFSDYAYKKTPNLGFTLFLCLMPPTVWVYMTSCTEAISLLLFQQSFSTRPRDTWIKTEVSKIKISLKMVDVEQKFAVYLYHRVVKLFNTENRQHLFL